MRKEMHDCNPPQLGFCTRYDYNPSPPIPPARGNVPLTGISCLLKGVSGHLKLETVALDRKAVTTVGGIRIQADLLLDQVFPDDSGMLILPGASSWDLGQSMKQ